jgi:hypothetical protein
MATCCGSIAQKNDTAIPDRLNCNPSHQNNAAIPDRFNGVQTVFYRLMSHGLRKALRRSTMMMHRAPTLPSRRSPVMMMRVLLRFPDARHAWMGAISTDSNSFVIRCCFVVISLLLILPGKHCQETRPRCFASEHCPKHDPTKRTQTKLVHAWPRNMTGHQVIWLPPLPRFVPSRGFHQRSWDAP